MCFLESSARTLAALRWIFYFSVKIGAVKTFDNFILDIPENIDPANYRALIVWCESFGEFITAASYR